MPDQVQTVRLVDANNNAIDVPLDQAGELLGRGGYRVETGADVASRAAKNVEEEIYGGPAGTVVATGAGIARGFTGGGSDALLSVLGAGEQLDKLRRQNPVASGAGEIVGALSPTGVGGVAARAGERAAGLIRGGGELASLARAGVQTGVEGSILGAGQGVTELALSDDPLSIERAASVIGSNALFGGAVGGGLGVAGKGLELGLTKAKGALDKYAAREAESAAYVGDDLAKMDRKALRAAEKSEMEAIEAARVPKRAEIADEVRALRSEMKEQKLWLATKDADVKAIKEIREVGKTALEADKSIDRMLRNPKALAERPQRVLDGLQQQEHALERLVAQGDNLRPIFAKDASGARQAAFDYASVALEKNRALQAKIAEVTGRATSPRLEAIGDAMAGLGKATAKEGATIGEMLGQSAIGHAVGQLSGIPYLGQAVLAAKAAGGVLKKLGANTGAAAERGSKAISTFLDVGSKVARPVPVVASKVLSSVRFREATETKKGRKAKASLADDYHARAAELRSLTTPGPDGSPVMRMEARQKIADRLAPIRAVSPVLADRIETTKVRGYEFLAGKLIRRPDLPGMGMGDSWQPSDMEMRGVARYMAAVEDPNGVVERLASGDVTPEDAEAMRTVYPEMYAQIQRDIMMQLGELSARLPYQRRLALSIFSGVPVDPAMDPRVLSILQGSFAAEEGSAGGTMAPRAQPAFGSVSKPEPTPAQRRGGE